MSNEKKIKTYTFEEVQVMYARLIKGIDKIDDLLNDVDLTIAQLATHLAKSACNISAIANGWALTKNINQ